jgi:hypothetical protein
VAARCSWASAARTGAARGCRRMREVRRLPRCQHSPVLVKTDPSNGLPEHGLKPHSHWDRTSGAASAKLGDRDEDEMADVQCSSKKSGETPRASAASLRDAVRERGRFPSHAARIGAGLSPLPHLRRRADPPLLACLLTRLAMRDRNRDTRPALRQQAVGGGGEPPLRAPPSALPEACYRRRPAARVRTRSARPQGKRVLRVRRTPLPRRTALAASY